MGIWRDRVGLKRRPASIRKAALIGKYDELGLVDGNLSWLGVGDSLERLRVVG
jgi:hypothetical protein